MREAVKQMDMIELGVLRPEDVPAPVAGAGATGLSVTLLSLHCFQLRCLGE